MAENYTFFKSYYEAIAELDDETRLKCFDAICKYALYDEETELSGIAKAVFTLVKPNIDASAKRRKNGKKGGRPTTKKKCGFEKEKSMVSENEKCGFEECESNKEKDKDKDKEYEYEKDKEYDKDSYPPNPTEGKPHRETQEQIFDRLVEDQNIGLEMENVLREWLRYKAERRDTYKETGMKSMITQVQNAVYRFGEVAVMNRIRDAMANSWKGMNLDKMGEGRAGQKNDAQDFINRWMNA